jgi:hypothetical protein
MLAENMETEVGGHIITSACLVTNHATAAKQIKGGTLKDICVIDEDDRKIWQGKCLSTPDAIGKLIKENAPGIYKIGLETGNLST